MLLVFLVKYKLSKKEEKKKGEVSRVSDKSHIDGGETKKKEVFSF